MFAALALCSWPAIVLVLFQKYSASVAVVVAIVAGYLLLPTIIGLDLPLLPELNKTSIPALAALLFAFLSLNEQPRGSVLPRWIPRGILPRFLILGLLIGSFVTVLTNRDAMFNLPALRIYDGFSVILSIFIMLAPFFLAYRFLASPEQHKFLLAALCIAGFAYSFLALYEIRMSPQLNRMIYGFFPHSFLQHVRAGGFRPLVFLDHGLWLAIFFAMSVIAAFGAVRVYPKHRVLFLLAGGWIFGTLMLSNSLGGFAIAVLFAPVVLFMPTRLQLLTAALVGVIVMTFPMLRERGMVTGDLAVSWAQSVSADRAQSLKFRLDNENILLEKANERPLFGWGGWGRARVYDEQGRDISVTDGYWVIIFGVGGWTRYLCEFGLMVLPLGLLFYRRRQYDIGAETATVAVVLAINLIDLIPNGTMTPVTMLVTGALWGRIDWKKPVITENIAATLSLRPISPYTRQTKRISGR